MKRLDAIKILIDKKILGPEECPEKDYWHWSILDHEKLPAVFLNDAKDFEEIRCYFTEPDIDASEIGE